MEETSKRPFYQVEEKPDFPKEEERILKYWNKIKAFETSLEKSKGNKPFTFYDGPPFATGLPHYGHLCAGTIKDIVTRYATQTGHYVERRFGWDCHGLPVEHEIDKTFNIKTKEDMMKMGIANYNKECRSIVMRYSSEWRATVNRMGRWIDFDNDYKTMDVTFMESCWWVFKQMFERGLVYRGCKIMPYSNACHTVLSNFEAGLNYKDVNDPSIYVTFPLIKEKDTKFVAWTTTPWTLPSNLALAVNPEFDYVKIKDTQTNEVYILAECRLQDLYPKGKEKEKDKEPAYVVLDKFKGQTLEGIEYVPLFENFEAKRSEGCFKVLCGDFVTNDTGTGIVHCAPAYGEEDYRICNKYKIIKPDAPLDTLDDSGFFSDLVPHLKGMYIKDADHEIKKDLKKRGRLIHESQINHSYPYCWRSDTPLIYRANSCWFFKVTDIKQDLIKNNKKAYWVPTFAQEGRFNNWLENAEDWCFSRNRSWGNPIPLWVSDDFTEVHCIGSIEELKKLTGIQEVKDLHRENIDHLTFVSPKTGKTLKRVEEVFDCWFESGSMPYAQVHYPFSMNEEEFSKRFPADFIGEGLDQTRGWFYTLNVISTAIRNDTPYKNLIVNGLVLAGDGKKMSKRLKNYSPPEIMINTYGADAIRLYLINSPLVRAETLNFKDDGVRGVVRDVFLPWYNAYRFLIQNITRWEMQTGKHFEFDETLCHDKNRLENLMDRWVIAANQTLIKFVREEMIKYRLYTVVPKLVSFLEQLTNWYVRLNRPRIKGEVGHDEWLMSLNVLFDVLFKCTILMAPFVPFITDMMYENLSKVLGKKSQLLENSIHFLQIPEPLAHLVDEDIEKSVGRMQKIIEVARTLREKKKISLKQPISSMTIIHTSDDFLKSLAPIANYLEEEINTPTIIFAKNIHDYVEYQALPNNQGLGKRLKKAFNKNFRDAVNSLSMAQIQEYRATGKLTVQGVELSSETEDLIIKMKYVSENLAEHFALGGEDDICVLLDTRQDEKLRNVGIAREIINKVQRMRKNAGLKVDDQIVVFYALGNKSTNLKKAIESERILIDQIVKKPFLEIAMKQSHLLEICRSSGELEDETYEIVLCYAGVLFNEKNLQQKFGNKAKDVKQWVLGYGYKDLKVAVEKQNGSLHGILDEEKVEVKHLEDFYLNLNETKI